MNIKEFCIGLTIIGLMIVAAAILERSFERNKAMAPFKSLEAVKFQAYCLKGKALLKVGVGTDLVSWVYDIDLYGRPFPCK